ncbi:MAG: xanthine dehydrogenase family protein molybdopterin-binding subunit [Chloroflexota bacterium]
MVISEKPTSGNKVVGTRPIRHDGLEKVTGRAQYGADVKLSGLAQAAVLRSPHAHARIKRLDTSKAEKLPGVLAVMTADDLPNAGSRTTHRIMARDTVVFKGHAVAAVAAHDRNTAQEALDLIEVEYEELPPVLNVDQAMDPSTPAIHPDLAGNHLGETVKGTNVASHLRHELGDPEEGLKRASTVVEREYELATVHQGYIEPQTGTALWDENGRITVWTSTQGAFGVRTQMADVFQVPESWVHVVPMEIGGGFGGKLNVYLEPLAAALSRKCGRPVKAYMDRKDVFEATGPAAGGKVHVKMGVDDNGRITGATADLRYEAGAFPGSPIGAGMVCCFAAYDIPDVRVDGYDVLVTKPKTAAYRAPGSTHVAFAVESVVDEICEKLGMDPFEFRLKNASHEGGRRVDGPIWGPIGIKEVLETAQGSPHWQSKLEKAGPDGKKRGRGLATGFWRNAGRRSTVHLNVNSDGTVSLVEGSVDIGGTRASIAMQAAEVLGIPAEDMIPQVASTNTIGYTDNTGGSRTTYATGFAAYRAAESVVRQMRERAAILWDLDAADIEYQDGVISSKADPELQITFKELASQLDGTGGPVAATGSVDLTEAGGAFGTHIVDVEVDPETGKVDVLRYTVVQDVGGAIHPSYVEGQMQGGAVQGIGWALNEEYVMSPEGSMLNASFLDYRMPTTYDIPEIETHIVEVPNPIHPFGARGVGEVPIAPPVGAIANALYDALGVRFRQAPMKPERILQALGVLPSSNGK